MFIFCQEVHFAPYKLCYGYHDLHEADKGEPHAEAHETAHVGHKPGDCGLLTTKRMKHLSFILRYDVTNLVQNVLGHVGRGNVESHFGKVPLAILHD